MAARALNGPMRALGRPRPSALSHLPARPFRPFHSSRPLLETPSAALPTRKPIGAFRGGLFGFLLGSTLAGGSVYYYILEEYKVSNELLTEDIYALQAAVQRVHTYVQGLEEKVTQLEQKKR